MAAAAQVDDLGVVGVGSGGLALGKRLVDHAGRPVRPRVPAGLHRLGRLRLGDPRFSRGAGGFVATGSVRRAWRTAGGESGAESSISAARPGLPAVLASLRPLRLVLGKRHELGRRACRLRLASRRRPRQARPAPPKSDAPPGAPNRIVADPMIVNLLVRENCIRAMLPSIVASVRLGHAPRIERLVEHLLGQDLLLLAQLANRLAGLERFLGQAAARS